MPLVAKGPKKLGTAEEEQNGKAKAQEVENEEKEESFVLVSNIPSSWHTHHLRWDQWIFQSYFYSKIHLCASGDTSVAGLRMRASAHSTSDTGQKKASLIQHRTILIQERHWQNETIFVGKDVAVAERAAAEEQNQRIDLMQKYSEETCTRVHLPGGLLLFWVLPKVYPEYFHKYIKETYSKAHL